MITSITMLSYSPTLQSASKFKTKSIDSVIFDAFEKEFPIEITYDYTQVCTWDKYEVTVLNFDYKCNDQACIPEKDLKEIVMDIIREEERCTVIFE